MASVRTAMIRQYVERTKVSEDRWCRRFAIEENYRSHFVVVFPQGASLFKDPLIVGGMLGSVLRAFIIALDIGGCGVGIIIAGGLQCRKAECWFRMI